ncbi:MAG: hypothetical protein ACRC6H_02465 [Culicoidibacterales bacterium]
MIVAWIQTLVHEENTIVNHKQTEKLTFIDQYFEVEEKRELHIGEVMCYAITARPKVNGDKVTVTKKLSHLFATA